MLIDEVTPIATGLENDVAVIESGFEILAKTDYPVLYTGLNSYNSRVIGSFIEEDEEDLTSLYYVHFILKPVEYADFVSNKITYRNIFELARTAYIIKSDLATLRAKEIHLIDANEINEEYWPHEKSYFPKRKKASSLSYSIYLQGGIADRHQALLSDSIAIQQAVEALLQESIYNLPNIAVSADVYELVPEQGSFKLSFVVDIKLGNNKTKDIFIRDELFAAYQNELIEYAIKYLPTEVSQLYYGNTVPQHFESLVKSTKALYNKIGISVEDSELITSLKESIHNTAGNIVKASKSVGLNYTSIEFATALHDTDASGTLGSVTSNSKTGLVSAVDFIDSVSKVQLDSETDLESQKYKIHIYNLNTESRKGTGIIINEDGSVFKPKIIISGNVPLENTKFTQSIHENTIIDVLGVGTRVNGKLTRLVIES